jgi:hypothetical protein
VQWIFCPIDSSLQKDTFDCGVLELNEYLKQYAKQNHKNGIAKTFVAIPNQENRIVVGYYSVSMSHIEHESLPSKQSKGLLAILFLPCSLAS